MDLSARMLRWAGWLCVSIVATLTSMGYHFGNIRFAPVAAGFAILAAVCLLDRAAGTDEERWHSPETRFGHRSSEPVTRTGRR